MRASPESTLLEGLFNGSTASAADAAALSDDFLRRLRQRFAAEPGRYAFEHQAVTLVPRRR